MMTWQTFATSVRSSVTGSRALAELINGVLISDQIIIKTIVKENSSIRPTIRRLIGVLVKTGRTLSGRMILLSLLNEYEFQAGWPTDDMTLRRVYRIYLSGKLEAEIPQLSKRLLSL